MTTDHPEFQLRLSNSGIIPFPDNIMESVDGLEMPKQEIIADDIDGASNSTTKCDFSRYGLDKLGVSESLELPEELVTEADIFHHVMSKKTWNEILTEEQRTRLKQLLPTNSTKSQQSTDEFLTKFFDVRKPLFLSHPLVDFQQKLAGGFYDADCVQEVRQLRACTRIYYEHRIREYHGRMLKKVLVNRRKVLEAAAAVSEGEPFTYDWKPDFIDNLHRERNHSRTVGDESPAWRRALKRSRMMIMDCKTRTGEPQTLSSDDEDYPSTAPKPGANGHHAAAGTSWQAASHHRQVGQAGHDASRVVSSPVRSTLAKSNHSDLDLHEPFANAEIKDMLKEYRRLKKTHPEHPSLEYDDTEMDDVVDRCGTEIRMMAQKWGVYTKQTPPASSADPIDHHPAAILSPSASSIRKGTSGKNQSRTNVGGGSKEKEKPVQ